MKINHSLPMAPRANWKAVIVLLIATLCIVVGQISYTSGFSFVAESRDLGEARMAYRLWTVAMLAVGPLLMLFGMVAVLGALVALAFRFVGNASSRR